MADVTLRPATVGDAEAMVAIYNAEVSGATSTFDLVPRTLADQERWISERSGAFSALVAVENGAGGAGDAALVGFASLSPYKERAAYRTTVEDSVYVARSAAGRGIGTLLLTGLIDVARQSGFHTVIARIEASGIASRALHERCGFELVGIEKQVGRKFNRWLDVAVLQLLL